MNQLSRIKFTSTKAVNLELRYENLVETRGCKAPSVKLIRLRA